MILMSVKLNPSFSTDGTTMSDGSQSARSLKRWLLVLLITGILLAGAGLLIKSLWLLGRVSPGFDPKGVLAARLSLPDLKYPKGIERAAVFKRVIERQGRHGLLHGWIRARTARVAAAGPG